MSSNLILKRICQHCGKAFIAKKTSTKFCSLQCGQRNYKVRQRINKVDKSNIESRQLLDIPGQNSLVIEQELIDIKALAYTISISERMLFNLIKNPSFPKLKIGRRLLFNKREVITYLVENYSVNKPY
jgi:predicted DNA-binding transcriptional regulator AlpA